MNIKINDVIKFNKNDYLVLDIIDNRYLYLINNNKFEDDTAIVKIVNKNRETEIHYIENDDEFYYALNRLFVNFKRDILVYFD